MLQFFSQNLIWTEGLNILIISILICIVLYFLFPRLLIFPVLFIFFSFYFFRNPERSISTIVASNSTFILSPCDGQVIDIVQEFDKNLNKSIQKVSIFLSPFDVHVNWIPVKGKVLNINYRPGRFFPAYQPKSSELNERNDILILSDCSKVILVRQIAGMIARRIVCWIEKDEYVKIGQKFGMIKFGSRIDALIEEPISLDVKVGQKVRGGETIMGKWTC